MSIIFILTRRQKTVEGSLCWGYSRCDHLYLQIGQYHRPLHQISVVYLVSVNSISLKSTPSRGPLWSALICSRHSLPRRVQCDLKFLCPSLPSHQPTSVSDPNIHPTSLPRTTYLSSHYPFTSSAGPEGTYTTSSAHNTNTQISNTEGWTIRAPDLLADVRVWYRVVCWDPVQAAVSSECAFILGVSPLPSRIFYTLKPLYFSKFVSFLVPSGPINKRACMRKPRGQQLVDFAGMSTSVPNSQMLVAV